MSLLSGFVQGAAGGIQQGWAELREDAQANAKESMQMRLQDRAVSLKRDEQDYDEKRTVGLLNDPKSSLGIAAKSASEAADLKHHRALELKGATASKPSLRLIDLGDDVKVQMDTNSGRILDPGGRLLSPQLTLEEAMSQAQSEADDKTGWFSSDESDLGMKEEQFVKMRAQEIYDQSTLASQYNIDPSLIVKSFNQQPVSQGGLLQQGSNSGSRVDKVKAVLQAKTPATVSEDKSKEPVKKESEKSILDEFNLPAPKKQNSGGLLKALNDDPVAGFIGREAVRSKDAIVNLSGQAIDAIGDRLTRPNPLSEKGREKAELALSRFFGGKPTLKDARNILHSGLVSGRKKEAVAEWIRLAGE